MVTLAAPVHTFSVLFAGEGRHVDREISSVLVDAGLAVREVAADENILVEYDVCRPDLVLLAVRSADCERMETCRRLRDRHGEDCAPMVLMTRMGGRAEACDWELPEGVVDWLPEPLNPSGLLPHIRALLHARRQVKRQQDRIAALNEVIAGKDRLLRMCAHDLRTPLSSVCGLAEFLLDPAAGALTPEQIEMADAIREAGRNMLKLVNRLLDLSVVQTGAVRIERRPALLRELVNRAVFLVAVVAARKNIRVVLQPPVSTEPVVHIDEVRIREVVDNLLSNAVKFSPPGSSIRVAIESLPGGAEAGPCVRLSVRDQGPGVPAEERDRLFQEFGRLTARPTGGESSTGLGLAICRRVVDLHGGTIGAVNHPEGGCVFSFTLPITP